MKKLFFLLFSVFISAQNISLLQSVQKGNEKNALLFNEKMLPDFKLVNTNKTVMNVFYNYWPNDTTQSEIDKCNITYECDRLVVMKYKVINSEFSFSEINADFNTLFQFWKTYIQSDPKKTNFNTYFYKDTEVDTDAKFWYVLKPGTKKKWTLTNMKER